MSDRCVLDPPAGLDRAHHHFAGVNADARFQRSSAIRRATLPVLVQLPLHLQRGIEPTLRMVLVRRRRPEQSEDAVAGRLHDVAVIALYRVHHDAQGRVDDCAGLFGIELLHQRGRALEVREQRRHRLALPVDSSGSETSVGCDSDWWFGWTDWTGIGASSAKRGAAFLAKSGSRTRQDFAGRTNE